MSNIIINSYAYLGSAPASSPVLEGEKYRWSETSSNTSTVTSVTSSISAGNRAVIVCIWRSPSQTLTTITDSQGNTWTLDSTVSDTVTQPNKIIAIYSSVLSTALVSGVDTISLAWASVSYSNKWGVVFEISNSSSVDVQSSSVAVSSTSVSSAASTTSSASVIIGCVTLSSVGKIYSGSSFTQEGVVVTFGAAQTYWLSSTEATSGVKDPGGSINDPVTWLAAWVAYS